LARGKAPAEPGPIKISSVSGKKPLSAASADRKRQRRDKNEAAHQANLRTVKLLGLPPEFIEKEIVTVRHEGKKALTNTRTVTKPKPPSKLLRKYNRRDLVRKKGADNA
jgi:hypothetical protein